MSQQEEVAVEEKQDENLNMPGAMPASPEVAVATKDDDQQDDEGSNKEKKKDEPDENDGITKVADAAPQATEKPKKRLKKRPRKLAPDDVRQPPNPLERPIPKELCHMHGKFRSHYGQTIELGGTYKGRWAYLADHVKTAHALAFSYDIISAEHPNDENMVEVTLVGHFEDDPVLYGTNKFRSDRMTLDIKWDKLDKETTQQFIGTGECDFYGPYEIEGRIQISSDGKRGNLDLVKINPNKRYDPDVDPDQERIEKMDIEDTACLPGCCCSNRPLREWEKQDEEGAGFQVAEGDNDEDEEDGDDDDDDDEDQEGEDDDDNKNQGQEDEEEEEEEEEEY